MKSRFWVINKGERALLIWREEDRWFWKVLSGVWTTLELQAEYLKIQGKKEGLHVAPVLKIDEVPRTTPVEILDEIGTVKSTPD